MDRPRTHRLFWLAAFIMLFVAACAGNGDDAAEVATLEDTVDLTADEAGSDSELTSDEAALVFSECLRAEGIDIPDIGIDADGNIDIRATFQDAGIDVRGDEFSAAREVCFPLLDGVAFGGGGRAGLQDNPEIADALLAFSDCIRDEGFDVGDAELPQPGAGGFTPPADGETPQRGEGQGQGGFGDPSARFAGLLGLDADDPDVAAALEVCGSIVSDAFAGFAPGGGN